jgi:hypothetical protein
MFEDADIIYTYTRAQAHEDGVLVNLVPFASDVCRQHYKYPISCTNTVFALIEKAVRNERYCNDYAGIIHDMLWMSKQYSRPNTDTVIFPCIIMGAGRRKNYWFKMVISPGDTPDPVITIMLPEED